ncbi:oxygenase MpaB family protein [Acinetobacter sp. XH1639]|uniref:oxygenase MpaB family protein n=1 Tax=Acinetobacter sp. XH1639 TaxID=3157368 RepID=UPI0032B58259
MRNFLISYKWIEAEINRLNPNVDSSKIIRLYLSSIFPRSAIAVNLLYTLGLIRLCSSREQSIPVHRNGQGKVYKRGDQRADETNYHLLMWLENDINEPHVQNSLAHVRRIHDAVGKSWIMRQEAFLHALASFTLLVDRFLVHILNLEALEEQKRAALLHQFQQVGLHLGIKNIPSTWQEMEAYLESYEQSDNMGYSLEGAQVAEALINQFVERWFPGFLYQQGRWLVVSLLEQHIVEALRLERPPEIFTQSIRFSVKTFIQFKRNFLPDPSKIFSLSEIAQYHKKSKLKI